jgi:hypothetical protein
MTKLITLLVLVVALWVGWRVVVHFRDLEERKQAEAAAVLKPEQLPGLPSHLYGALDVAQRSGPAALGEFLRNFGAQLEDPRRAWLEMDYCVAIRRDNPQEARRVFAAMKARVKPNSVVYPRVQQLEKSFE